MSGVAQAFSRAAASARAPRAPAPARTQRVPGAGFRVAAGAMIWVLIVLMIVPDGFDYSELSSSGAPGAGGSVSRMLWLALLGGGTLLVLWRAAFAWLLARRLNPFLLAFVVLALASVAWSMDPQVTARRLIRVLTIVVDAAALMLVGWHALRFQSVLRPILTAVLLGSLAFGLAWPTLAIHQDTTGALVGAWHGLASHKNGLGDIACIGMIFWIHAWLARQARAVPALIGAALAAACLLLSRSSTSLVAAVIALAFMAMLMRAPRALQRSMPVIVALVAAALLAYSAALLFWPGLGVLLSPIGAITGKDMTFTGRTDIWAITLEHIRLHPYLGSGYGAFWTGATEGTPSYEFVLRLAFYPGSAHNGYLEVLNDLGALGLVVLFGYLVTFVAQSLQLMKSDRLQAALYLALFLQQAITNLSESRWFSALSVDFVIMTLATAALARTLIGQQLRVRRADPRPLAPRVAPYLPARLPVPVSP